MTDVVLVGVDSGGTRTNVEIAIGDGLPARSYEVGESLSGTLEPVHYASCLRKILAPIELHFEELGITDLPAYAFVSAAGFTPSVREDFIQAIHDVCPGMVNGRIAAVGIANDAVTLLLGLRADGVIIAGTGSNVIVRSPDGTVYQVGGHEWVACDDGSAFWIGLRAIRQAYRDFEAGVESVLLERLREVYGVRRNDGRRLVAMLRDRAIADANMKREIARFAAGVCAAAERGDVDAQNVVKAEAEGLADVTAGALRRRCPQLSEGISLVQCGSILGNEFYRASFEAQLEMRLRSGSDQRPEIQWRRVTTGGGAAVNLARDLKGSMEEVLKLDIAFRPAVVRL